MKGLGPAFVGLSTIISFSDVHALITVKGVSVHRVPLRQNDDTSPYCYAASSIADLKGANFLATQVWPSARVASLALERHVSKEWTVCEFGCGPGLPSLTAATLGCQVYATDLDEFALELVQAAAQSQQLLPSHVQTRRVDLIQGFEQKDEDWIQDIDLFLFSDVFENGHVAQGAARITQQILQTSKAKVWVFAQSDRAQREVFLKELQQTINPKLAWQPIDSYNTKEQLWLCDLDETTVSYG
jgi:hypothetical protein